MSYTTFSQTNNNALLEPMFFGNQVNVSRYDQQRHPIFEKLIEKQLSFFWRPEEVDVSRDQRDWQTELTSSEKHIFINNLKYQTLLDSVQGRSPNAAFLPLVSLPEVETWIETWAFSETIHSRSYTHILRNLFSNPSVVFDDIVVNENILSRATDISKYYDDLILKTQLWQSSGYGTYVVAGKKLVVTKRELKKALVRTMMSVNALEAVRFYVSFACTFAFVERELMEGSGKIMKLIARDENLHKTGTQHIINLWLSGRDDPEMVEILAELRDESTAIFLAAEKQEEGWAKYLFKDGSMIGMNEEILCQYVKYISSFSMEAIGLENPFGKMSNPIPWINPHLGSDNVQVAPQESEISSYLVGQIDNAVNSDEFGDFSL